MKVERIKENLFTTPESVVTLKTAGNISEIRYMAVDSKCKIRKLDKDCYVDIETGEVKEFEHTDLRIDNTASLSRSMRDLRDLINANTSKPKNCLWVTLTYQENMQNPEKLYDDFRKFNMRLGYYLCNHNLSTHEYIAVAEPQGRGAWHLHVILIFPKKAPFIANDDLSQLWGHGFTKISSLKNVDNVGLYLTAYLCDMDITDAFGTVDLGTNGFKEITVTDENGRKRKKAIIKGARLKLYPVGFRLYRCSRNVKRPIISRCTEKEALQKVGNSTKTFEETIQISDNGKVVNTIYYRHFNKKPKSPKVGDTHGEKET